MDTSTPAVAEGGAIDILVITADAVKETGIVSFKFMNDADPKGDKGLRPMPQQWGYVWRVPDGTYAYNIFRGGVGLVVGGGFEADMAPDWEKEMIYNIPPCTLLMDVDLLPWWRELAERNGVKFRHHHHEGILTTS